MKNFDFFRLFGNDSNSASKKRTKKQRQGHTCRIEELEGREMLSVTPWSLVDDTFFHYEKPESVSLVLEITDGTNFQTVSDSLVSGVPMPLTAPLLDASDITVTSGENSVTLSVALETLDEFDVFPGELSVMFKLADEVEWIQWTGWFDWEWANWTGDASITITHLAAGNYDFRLMYWVGDQEELAVTTGTALIGTTTAPPATNPSVVLWDISSDGFELWWDAEPDTAYRVTCTSHPGVFGPMVVVSEEYTGQGIDYCEAYAYLESPSVIAGETYEFSITAINANGIDALEKPTTVTIAFPGNPDVPDTGSSIATAFPVVFSDNVYTITQNIRYDGIHMYAINVSQGEVGKEYIFATSQPPGAVLFDTYIRLFNADGVQLAFNDDFGDGSYSYLTYTFFTAGTYYLGVSGFSARNYNPNVDTPGTSFAIAQYALKITAVTYPLTGITVSTDSPQVGMPITATVVPGGATATYQWYRGGNKIEGAIFRSYTPTVADVGHFLRVEAIGTGSYTDTRDHILTNKVTSALTGISINTNSPQVGDEITATLLPAGATADYQWYRGMTAISGATSSSYTVDTADLGTRLTVVAIGTDDYTGTIESAPTNAVTAALTSVTPSTDSPQVGTPITATVVPAMQASITAGIAATL